MDEMLWAAAMVAAFLLLLSLLHCPGKVHYEFLSHALNSIEVFTLGPSSLLALSSSKCAIHTAGVLAGWVPFSSLAMRWFHCLFLFQPPSLPGDNQSTFFIGAALQVGYHCLELFREPTVKVLMLQFGYAFQRKMFWE